MSKTFVILLDVDDDKHIVTSYVYRTAGNGSQSYQTAWNDERFPVHVTPQTVDAWTVTDDSGDQIMTYESRDEAIGELVTSIRNNFDDDKMYS